MRTCLLLEVLTHLALALTTVGWVAMIVMVVFGAYAFIWATVSQTVRQRVVPTELQGRVGSVYMVGLFAGLIVGQVIGGWSGRVGGGSPRRSGSPSSGPASRWRWCGASSRTSRTWGRAEAAAGRLVARHPGSWGCGGNSLRS